MVGKLAHLAPLGPQLLQHFDFFGLEHSPLFSITGTKNTDTYGAPLGGIYISQGQLRFMLRLKWDVTKRQI